MLTTVSVVYLIRTDFHTQFCSLSEKKLAYTVILPFFIKLKKDYSNHSKWLETNQQYHVKFACSLLHKSLGRVADIIASLTPGTDKWRLFKSFVNFICIWKVYRPRRTKHKRCLSSGTTGCLINRSLWRSKVSGLQICYRPGVDELYGSISGQSVG